MLQNLIIIMPGPNFIDIFPAELLINIIQRIPFDSRLILTLALVHPRIRDLVSNYQLSITKNFARSNLPHVFQDFPLSYKEGTITYNWLSKCIRQYDVIDDVMAVLTSDLNCYAVEKHNMAVVNTGLLLLYRLCTVGEFKIVKSRLVDTVALHAAQLMLPLVVRFERLTTN